MNEQTGDFAFELVFDRLGHGLVRVDRDLQVVSTNAAARRHFHPTPLREREPLPEPWRELSLRESVDRLFHQHAPARRSRRSPGFVSEARNTRGRTFRITGFPPAGDAPALLHVEDRTAAEQRGRAEREFVANAAHELLTPLTGIVTAAYALEAGAKLVPEERDRFIAHIVAHADRMTRVARGLLVLARAQSGQEPPRLELLPLRALLEDAVTAIGSDHDSSVSLHCPPDVQVFVDRDLADQAFTNLVANAARHASGDTIIVSADEIGAHEVGIEVADSGAGVAPEHVVHLGDRFYTGEGRDGGGFGLGISIARQAVELLGGTLTYASTPGEGTRARIRLPSGRLAAL